jgi:hypothetical protein
MTDKPTRKTLRSAKAVLLAIALASTAAACSDGGSPLPDDVKAIMFLQRMPRQDQGNVFEYTSFAAGGRLVMLEPPSADGRLTVLTDLPALGGMFAGADIMSYDLSFDAKSVVFSARLADAGSYHIFSMNLDGTNFRQLTSGASDYVFPLFVPGGRILYMTNYIDESIDDASASQFVDEYERQVTAQVGTMALDGSNPQLGARNVSHRVAPSLLPDGRIVYTEWRHMGMINDGHLRVMNTDMTGMGEAFGGELESGVSANSYLKARPLQKSLAPGEPIELVTIATSRDRTLQSGKLIQISLNGTEAASTRTDLTPTVPAGEVPSQANAGRYYDAEIVGLPANRQFLVSWADGPVESEALALAGTNAQFGIFLLDARRPNSALRYPIYDDPTYWDVMARPVATRPEPSPVTSPISGTDTTIGALNVYESSLASIKQNIPAGSVVKVRLLEGFSGEEGGVDMFGTTEFDGQSNYGEINLQPDGSFAATVPGNVPFHIQLIDKFATSVANESIWISGRGGEQRFCGGCHESRSGGTVVQPGIRDAVLRGAVNLVVPRAQRLSTTAYSLSGGNFSNPSATVRGVPWDLAIQPILDAKCASCHNGQPGPANPSYTITDNMTGMSQMFVFDLRGQKVNVMIGERATGDFTASYLSLMGLGEIISDAEVTFDPPPTEYVVPASARDSLVIQKLNPPQRFPSVDMNVRMMPGQGTHASMVGAPELTADEYYLLIMNIDMGAQFFFRENLNTAGSN